MRHTRFNDSSKNDRRIDMTPAIVVSDPELIKVSSDPIRITEPVDMEIPATTFKWSLKPEDLAKALRPYVHEMVKGLPGHHFLKVEPSVGAATKEFLGVNITIVVPEK